MKKKLASVLITAAMIGAVSMTAAADSNSNEVCYTKVSAEKDSVMGVTSYNGAVSCSVTVTAYYPGGSKTESSTGVTAASTTVWADEEVEFTSATTIHRIEYYVNGYFNTMVKPTYWNRDGVGDKN